jgi:hypothetical protein
MKVRKYYWLMLREDGRWTSWFGSFDRSEVDFERQDRRESGVMAKDLRIFMSECSNGSAHMHAAEREMERLNAIT